MLILQTKQFDLNAFLRGWIHFREGNSVKIILPPFWKETKQKEFAPLLEWTPFQKGFGLQLLANRKSQNLFPLV